METFDGLDQPQASPVSGHSTSTKSSQRRGVSLVIIYCYLSMLDSMLSQYMSTRDYTRYQFIRNVAKLQLVPFLIFFWILTSLRFLNFQKYIVTVSYILPNFRTLFDFFIGWIMKGYFNFKKSLIILKNYWIMPKTVLFMLEKIYYLCLLTKLFNSAFLKAQKVN